MQQKSITWEALAWTSSEHCQITFIDQHYLVTSMLKGELDAQPFEFAYTIRINEKWQVISVQIVSLIDASRRIGFTKNLLGQWMDANNHPLDEFAKCVDLDITLTPFTNTLPIRRLTFAENQKHEITVLYIDLPSGYIRPMKQWYTKLANNQYKFEDETGYTNIITVDEDGFVTEYPHLFRRKVAQQ